MVEGLCYQSVVGVTRIGQSYLASGVFALFLIILMHGVWRRASDNLNENMKLRAAVAFTLGESVSIAVVPK